MTIHTCAVADCTSSSRKNDGVKGWAPFPSKLKQPARRRLWETRCKRPVKWKAKAHSRLCSLHFREWTGNRPSKAHPDPECFAYNDWGKIPSPRRKNTLQKIKAATHLAYLPRKDTSADEDLEASDVDADADTVASSAATPARSEHYIDDSCITTLIADVSTVARPAAPTTEYYTLASCIITSISGALAVAQNVEVSNSQNLEAQGGTPQLHARGPASQSGGLRSTPRYDGAGTHSAIMATPSRSADHSYSQTCRPVTDAGGEPADAGVQTCITMTQAERNKVFLEAFKDKVLASDESVRKYTGMRTRKLLFDIFSLIDECITVQYWRGKKNTLERRKDPRGAKPKLSKFDEYLMTLIHAKERLQIQWLSDLFGLGHSSVSNILITWINLLHQVFTKYLRDLSPETVHMHLPESYPLQSKDTKVILDHVLSL